MHAESPIDRPLRVADVARLLDASPQHVRNLTARGLIPGAFRLGKLIRYRRDLVTAWLASRTQDGTAK